MRFIAIKYIVANVKMSIIRMKIKQRCIMFRKEQRKKTIAAMACAGMLTLTLSDVDSVSAFFCADDAPSFNATVTPMVNLVEAPSQCASSKQNERVSWLSWVTGQSSSFEFHFLDLLELLSREDAETYHATTP